jgi:hypothetical protein
MKKIIFILVTLVSFISASAQEEKIIDMNRTFNISGECIMFSKTPVPKREDLCNLTFEFANKVLINENSVTLKLKDADGHAVDFYSWNDGVHIMLLIGKDGNKMYTVSDDTFSHLRIMEIEKGKWGISVSSELIDEWAK